MATLYNTNSHHFSLQNYNFSQDFLMTSPNNNNNNTNLCPLPPQIYDFNNGFCQIQQQQQQQQQQQMVSFSYPCSSSSSAFANSCMENSQSFSSLVDKHRQEIDLYLHFQGEKLKEALQQQKKQQMSLVLSRFQSRSMALLSEKEENLSKIREKTIMLEEYLKRKEEENQVWQRVAKEKEAMMIELNKELFITKQNFRNLVPGKGGKIDDIESVCDHGSLNNVGGNKLDSKRVCQWCNAKEMNVVFLPCRHLCCCKECESVIGFCLVCLSVKEGSIEILLT